MESVNRFFLMAAGLIITAGLIFLAFRMLNIGTETAGYVIEEVMTFSDEMRENELLQYDGTQVRGSDVSNFLRKHLENDYEPESELIVTVITERGRQDYRSYEDIKEINNFSHVAYIDPISLFMGTVERNENGVICGICFEQR